MKMVFEATYENEDFVDKRIQRIELENLSFQPNINGMYMEAMSKSLFYGRANEYLINLELKHLII